MKTSVYLADLRYNYSGILANDCMPLGVAYMKAVMDRDLPEVSSRLFVYPERLWDALESETPDVLMLSNYMWCEALSFHFAKLAKRIKPDMLVVMGGPNIPLEEERQKEYLAAHPEIDIYVLGEGDLLATEVVKHFLDVGKDIRALGARDIPSCVYRRPDGTVVLQKMWDREKEVDSIPSPWLTGIQDEFFDGKLAPLIETNRGCPFTCTFCVQGTRWYTKVHNFSKERMKEEIRYIAKRVKEVCPNMGTLRIADSNYGMFERDIEISSYLGETQRDYNWPLYIDATTGKNRPDRIIKSVEQVSGALVLYQAVQSLDENVLRNVKRSTIKLEAYEQLQVHMRGRGLRSNSDLILGLPGESLKTHLAAVTRLLDGGVDQVTNFQLMLLKGSELESIETRGMFSFESRYRVLAKNFGIYGDEKVVDVEEIVVSTDTLPFEDYIRARKYALASVAFWHDNSFADLVRFCEAHGVKGSTWLHAILPEMESSTGKITRYLQDFEGETRNELFPTKEACLEFYHSEENWEKLVRGDIGDNLMHKYQAKASFHIWPEICSVAMQATRKLIDERGISAMIPDFEEFWANFHRFEELQHAHGETVEQVMAPQRAVFTYDIEGWIKAGYPLDVAAFRLSLPTTFEFQLSEEAQRGLGSALQVWGINLKGLTKMMKRIRVAWLVRQGKPEFDTGLLSQSMAAGVGNIY